MSIEIAYSLPCGCEATVEAGYDWVDERIEIEDVDITKVCNSHIWRQLRDDKISTIFFTDGSKLTFEKARR